MKVYLLSGRHHETGEEWGLDRLHQIYSTREKAERQMEIELSAYPHNGCEWFFAISEIEVY